MTWGAGRGPGAEHSLPWSGCGPASRDEGAPSQMPLFTVPKGPCHLGLLRRRFAGCSSFQSLCGSHRLSRACVHFPSEVRKSPSP